MLFLALMLAGSAAAETVATFTLDSLSFVSFGDSEYVYLPAGSTLEFRFGTPEPDGTTSFTIQPSGVAIQDVSLPTGGVLRYSMASPASGVMQSTPEGRKVTFSATVRATLDTGSPGDGSYDYTIPFTTETTAASNLAGTETLTTFGMRLVDGVWYGQIVGATTNKENAFPEPGAAVYTVLSGSFDQVP
ncbi:MAG: hypothetical protein ACQGVC_07755 [Myxococcota bacterium]